MDMERQQHKRRPVAVDTFPLRPSDRLFELPPAPAAPRIPLGGWVLVTGAELMSEPVG